MLKRVFFYFSVTPFVWITLIWLIDSMKVVPHDMNAMQLFFTLAATGLSILIANRLEETWWK
jgi:hypothetical protein